MANAHKRTILLGANPNPIIKNRFSVDKLQNIANNNNLTTILNRFSVDNFETGNTAGQLRLPLFVWVSKMINQQLMLILEITFVIILFITIFITRD